MELFVPFLSSLNLIAPKFIWVQTQGNTNLNKYKRAFNISKMAQEVSLYFDDLKDNTKYQIFITVASNLPYIDPP
jgi:hypothetical protein